MEDWVEVRNCAWLHEAQFLGSVLDSAGIEWLIPDEYTIGVHPGFVPAIGGIRLLVHAKDLEHAREILDGRDGVAPEPNDG
jgi:hypothetical protein